MLAAASLDPDKKLLRRKLCYDSDDLNVYIQGAASKKQADKRYLLIYLQAKFTLRFPSHPSSLWDVPLCALNAHYRRMEARLPPVVLSSDVVDSGVREADAPPLLPGVPLGAPEGRFRPDLLHGSADDALFNAAAPLFAGDWAAQQYVKRRRLLVDPWDEIGAASTDEAPDRASLATAASTNLSASDAAKGSTPPLEKARQELIEAYGELNKLLNLLPLIRGQAIATRPPGSTSSARPTAGAAGAVTSQQQPFSLFDRTVVEGRPPPPSWFAAQGLRSRGYKSLHLAGASELLLSAAARLRAGLGDRVVLPASAVASAGSSISSAPASSRLGPRRDFPSALLAFAGAGWAVGPALRMVALMVVAAAPDDLHAPTPTSAAATAASAGAAAENDDVMAVAAVPGGVSGSSNSPHPLPHTHPRPSCMTWEQWCRTPPVRAAVEALFRALSAPPAYVQLPDGSIAIAPPADEPRLLALLAAGQRLVGMLAPRSLPAPHALCIPPCAPATVARHLLRTYGLRLLAAVAPDAPPAGGRAAGGVAAWGRIYGSAATAGAGMGIGISAGLGAASGGAGGAAGGAGGPASELVVAMGEIASYPRVPVSTGAASVLMRLHRAGAGSGSGSTVRGAPEHSSTAVGAAADPAAGAGAGTGAGAAESWAEGAGLSLCVPRGFTRCALQLRSFPQATQATQATIPTARSARNAATVSSASAAYTSDEQLTGMTSTSMIGSRRPRPVDAAEHVSESSPVIESLDVAAACAALQWEAEAAGEGTASHSPPIHVTAGMSISHALAACALGSTSTSTSISASTRRSDGQSGNPPARAAVQATQAFACAVADAAWREACTLSLSHAPATGPGLGLGLRGSASAADHGAVAGATADAPLVDRDSDEHDDEPVEYSAGTLGRTLLRALQHAGGAGAGAGEAARLDQPAISSAGQIVLPSSGWSVWLE